ncbi:flagellar basal body P-ring formation protein FlgA [Shimia sp. R9_1]|uniref:flagellar basal body P-ring formation chaperone FlgA n=1 Tax=unclassified Shimia TaxID=2630038 RepID=UPI001ADA4045|nr:MULTISPECIES: flagellar basal body P-ring formation chaperone FlgA [unclassified Shimia]MBO9395417.1 flagellar basal body P-ring formation protein FlgA [Shimia sp. R9_2]MBO9399530.1 flagellar basal body P-ring formation protein FlgA [Shimia sp. R9_3]MBO9407421.1 flagellar basal body P-ring formation protein FlgA [Shimia sp. R9_1]
MKRILAALLLVCAAPVSAEIVVATQTIRANTIVTADAVGLKQGDVAGVHSDLEAVIGLEARKAIYPGRPVRLGDVGAPALVERNQIVTLRYNSGGLEILTEGRSLARAGAGEALRVMNIGSRSTVTGTVMPDGSVHVSN